MADRVITADAVVRAVAYTRGGKWIAGVCGDNKVRLWDSTSGALLKTLAWDQGDSAIALLPQSGGFATVGSDGAMKFFDLETGTAATKVAGPKEKVRRVGFSADHKLAAGSTRVPDSSNELIHVWDASGNLKFSAPAGIGGTSAMAFSPDGGTFVAASYDTDMRAWSTRNGELLRMIGEIPVATFAAVFSPDGKWLATAGVDKLIHLWDSRTWKLARTFTGQPEMISSMAFSDDGKRLVTGGFSELTSSHPVKVIVWNVASGKSVKSFQAKRQVVSVAFSPDGATVAAATGEKTISLWAVTP